MTAVGNFAVGEVLTAASLNEIGAWTNTTTPTTSGLTKGNATQWYMKYYRLQNIGFISCDFTLGSTSDVTGDVSITLPSGWSAAGQSAGLAQVQAAGTFYVCYWRTNAAGTAILVRAINAAGTYAQSTNFTNTTVPADWTTGDFIRFLAVIELSA